MLSKIYLLYAIWMYYFPTPCISPLYVKLLGAIWKELKTCLFSDILAINKVFIAINNLHIHGVTWPKSTNRLSHFWSAVPAYSEFIRKWGVFTSQLVKRGCGEEISEDLKNKLSKLGSHLCFRWVPYFWENHIDWQSKAHDFLPNYPEFEINLFVFMEKKTNYKV